MTAKSITLQNYYNRFDETKNYDMHLVRDGNAGQGAEINEIQSALLCRIKKIADGIYKDGDVLKDAQLVVNAETGEVKAQNGQVYINGAVRGVPGGDVYRAGNGHGGRGHLPARDGCDRAGRPDALQSGGRLGRRGRTRCGPFAG